MSSLATPLTVNAANNAVIFVAFSDERGSARYSPGSGPEADDRLVGRAALIVAVPFTVTVRSWCLELDGPVSCASDGSVRATIAPSTNGP